jgi:hypothetical protein
MALYYFDIDDGDLATVDAVGSAFEDLEALKADVIRALAEIVHDKASGRGQRGAVIKVRDQQGRYVFQAALTLDSGFVDTDESRRPAKAAPLDGDRGREACGGG